MKTDEFNKNYVLEDTKKGVKARPKNGKEPVEAHTANGEIFNPEEIYFYFCTSTKAIRDTRNLRRIDNDSLGSFGLRLTKISDLHTNENDAIAVGQKFYRVEIAERETAIKNLEKQRAK